MGALPFPIGALPQQAQPATLKATKNENPAVRIFRIERPPEIQIVAQ